MLNDNFERCSESMRDDDPIERLLDRFTPIANQIDRDQLMFRAGMSAAQASLVSRPAARLRNRVWPALAIISTAAALVLGVVSWHRPAAQVIVVERPAAATAPVPAVETAEVPQLSPARETISIRPTTVDPASNYLLQRDRVLRDGPDALANAVLEGSSYSKFELPTQRHIFQELPGEFHRPTAQVESNDWWKAWLISGDRS